MLKNSNRRGYALGAVFALLASLFGAVPASAAATDGAQIAVRPAAGTTFAGTVREDFPVFAQMLTGETANLVDTKFVWKIERTAGSTMDVIFTTSATANGAALANDLLSSSATATTSQLAAGATAPLTISAVSGGGFAFLNMLASSASGVASWSSVTLKITGWIDDTGASQNYELDADEWFTTKTVTLYATGDLTSTVTLTSPSKDDTTVTVSATAPALNYANLTGKFFLAVSSSHNAFNSGTAGEDSTSPIGGTTLADRSGVVSSSFTVARLSESQSVSAALRYDESGTGGTSTAGHLIGSVVKKIVSDPGVSAVTASVVASAHSTASGQAAAVRPNQTYTVKLSAVTGSTSVSADLTVALSGEALSSPTKMISINGGAFTSSYPTALTVTTGADGYGTFTITTTGFVATDHINVDASIGNVSATQLVITATAPYYTVTNDYDLVVTKPGTGVTLNYQVKDQWQVLSAETNQRLYITKGGSGFNYGTTESSVAVVGGKASFTYVPEAATTTGSATVQSALQEYSAGSSVWAALSGAVNAANVTVNVTGDADSFTTAPTASVSASVSYAVATGAYSWSSAITGYTKNAGAAVVVSSAGLHFQDTVTEDTASDTITVRANSSGLYSFKAASNKSGTYTVSITVGSATTTSQVIISEPGSDQGASIIWDTTNIVPGKTRIVTGTLVDAAGNPVYTDWFGSVDTDATTASILVTYAGTAGIPVGTMPTETDVNGKFQVSVLTSTADSGTFTLTAVYSKDGTSTATADKITSVQAITVGAETASADQKITVGTFKGYVAIYTKGYMGQKLSAKVAGKWLVVDPIVAYKSNDYSRTVRLTGAGYTIDVDLYIDGVFVRSETVVTK
jgi:hypothetical protein